MDEVGRRGVLEVVVEEMTNQFPIAATVKCPRSRLAYPHPPI